MFLRETLADHSTVLIYLEGNRPAEWRYAGLGPLNELGDTDVSSGMRTVEMSALRQ
jgi:hypothetical protein